MKQIFTPKTLLLALLGIAIIASCKKSNNITAVKPTILVSKIIDNTQSHASFGKPLVEFAYAGKQLAKTLTYVYSGTANPTSVQTDLFVYNSEGVFTGALTSHGTAPMPNDLTSSVIYSGGHISEITTKRADGFASDTRLNYQNGQLSAIEYIHNTSPVSTDSIFTFGYNANSQNNIATYGAGAGSYLITSTAFDNNKNLRGAFPFWEFFYAGANGVFHGPELLSSLFCGTPGNNNSQNVTDNGNSATITYEYNSNGYPSAVTFTGTNIGLTVSYAYQYIQVN